VVPGWNLRLRVEVCEGDGVLIGLKSKHNWTELHGKIYVKR
jgi:hypothetical protein